MSEVNKVILDASALMVLIAKENGWENVLPLLPGAIMSSVNLSEIAKILIEKHGIKSKAIQSTIEKLIEEVIPFDKEQAYVTAELSLITKQYGLSLGDRACLALGKIYGYKVYTADREWVKVTLDDIKIELVR